MKTKTHDEQMAERIAEIQQAGLLKQAHKYMSLGKLESADAMLRGMASCAGVDRARARLSELRKDRAMLADMSAQEREAL